MQGGNMHTPSVFEIEGKPAHRKSPPRTRMTFDGKYQSIVDRILSRYYREQPQSLDEIALSPDAEMYCPLSLSMSNEKVGLVKEYPFEDFCLQHFQPRTSWGVKVPITELLSFSPVLINKPLTKLDPSLRKKATQAFKSTVYADITSYMKARNSSRNSLHHIIKVLKSAVDHLDLRDEVYCQLIKQTNNNPSKSALRAWKLFGVCAGVFAPSSQLRLPLLNHLVTIVENEEEAIAQRARYCANRGIYIDIYEIAFSKRSSFRSTRSAGNQAHPSHEAHVHQHLLPDRRQAGDSRGELRHCADGDKTCAAEDKGADT